MTDSSRNTVRKYIHKFIQKRIIEGRDFRIDAESESSNVIITQSFEKLLGKESAVGKIIQSPRGIEDGLFTNMTVVGVVSDYVLAICMANRAR